MRVTPLAVGVVCLLAAAPARAQEASPPASTTAGPQWSLGAGLSLGTLTVSGTSTSAFGLGGSSLISTPQVSVGLERRVAPKVVLLLGLAAAMSSTGSSPENLPAGSSAVAGTAHQSISVSVGARQVLLGEAALVALSGYVALTFGYARQDQFSASSSGGTTFSSSTVTNLGSVSLVGGISLERTLLEQLALRLNLSVLSAGYSAGRSPTSIIGAANVSGFSLGVVIQPGLELRMYF